MNLAAAIDRGQARLTISPLPRRRISPPSRATLSELMTKIPPSGGKEQRG
jgi:hypothetical protein